MRAKLYSQCYLGGSRRDMSCTEALVLAYPQETRGFVSDQVSTLIDPDLPLYYWASDNAPGDVSGQGVQGVWFVVAPDGSMLTTTK